MKITVRTSSSQWFRIGTFRKLFIILCSRMDLSRYMFQLTLLFDDLLMIAIMKGLLMDLYLLGKVRNYI